MISEVDLDRFRARLNKKCEDYYFSNDDFDKYQLEFISQLVNKFGNNLDKAVDCFIWTFL